MPDVCELSQRLAEGNSTASALVEDCLERIARIDPVLKAFVAMNSGAQAEAVASDARRAAGTPLSPIDGIPVAIKDNLVVMGMPCTWGSRVFADFTPEHDELPIERLRSLGAVILGKTNVPEFTLEGYCGNALHGVTRNPWDTQLTPGGSSGGSAAAVAAGLVPFAMGTDGGGSIRRPAAYTGLVGLKPSIGRIPRQGGLPQLLLDFEVVGPLTRSVRDARMILDLLSGPDARDHRSSQFSNTPTKGARPLNILYVDQFNDAPLDKGIAQSVGEAVDQLADLGHAVTRGALPFELDAVTAFWPRIGQIGLAELLSAQPEMEHSAAGKYVEMARSGQSVLATEVHRGLEAVWALRNAVGMTFKTLDLIVTPSCAAMPWPAAEAYPDRIDDHPVGPRGHAIYTGWVNACGHPAISLPSAPSADGLPIGFQMVAGFGREDLLLDVADQYEATQPWANRLPQLNWKHT